MLKLVHRERRRSERPYSILYFNDVILTEDYYDYHASEWIRENAIVFRDQQNAQIFRYQGLSYRYVYLSYDSDLQVLSQDAAEYLIEQYEQSIRSCQESIKRYEKKIQRLMENPNDSTSPD